MLERISIFAFLSDEDFHLHIVHGLMIVLHVCKDKRACSNVSEKLPVSPFSSGSTSLRAAERPEESIRLLRIWGFDGSGVGGRGRARFGRLLPRRKIDVLHFEARVQRISSESFFVARKEDNQQARSVVESSSRTFLFFPLSLSLSIASA